MKKNKNKLVYGILSLALALSLPLNASATVGLTKPDSIPEQQSQSEEANPTENTKLVPEAEIDKTPTPYITENLQTTPQEPASNQVRTAPLPQVEKENKNENYISLKVKEKEEDKKEKTFRVTLYDALDPTKRLKKERIGATNHFTLSYSFGINGDDLKKEYRISVFALKDSKVKSLELDNYITDSKVTSDGEKMEKEIEEIETDDYKGYKIKTKLIYTGSVKVDVKFDENAEPGDYSLYYIVEMDGEKVLGKIDVTIEKAGNDDFFVSRDQVVRDYEDYSEEKVNPFAELPFTKYLLNDTEYEKKLTDYVAPIQAKDGKNALKITYIDPTSKEEKEALIDNIEEYRLPANSLLRLDVIDKEEGEKLIKTSEIKAQEEEKAKEKDAPMLMATSLNPSDQAEDKAAEARIKKLNSMADLFKKEVVGDVKYTPLEESNYTEEQLKRATKELEKALEEKKRSIIEINPLYDESEAEILGLSMILRDQADKIDSLIQQALLDHELDSLEELEKTNPDQANEEYKRLKSLIKEADSVKEKANKKLIELDEINLIVNKTDPLLRAKKGEKVVLNLGKLTPITRIDDLTYDSPAESERDFSKNLEKKLERAMKKVETVTLDKKDDEKAKSNKNYGKKASKEDKNKKIIAVDKKAKENQDKKEDTDQNKTTTKTLNLPVFERYLQRLKG